MPRGAGPPLLQHMGASPPQMLPQAPQWLLKHSFDLVPGAHPASPTHRPLQQPAIAVPPRVQSSQFDPQRFGSDCVFMEHNPLPQVTGDSGGQPHAPFTQVRSLSPQS